MRLLINYALACLLFFTSPHIFAGLSLSVLPEKDNKTIINALNTAKNTLDITMYGFTDKEIAKTLIQAQERGVSVALLIENQPYKAQNENTRVVTLLKKAGIPIHYASTAFSLTHQKTILIDRQRALILTDNFTYSGLHKQRNFILDTDDAETVNDLTNLFEADWNGKSYHMDNKDSALVISPINSRQKLNAFVQDTQKELDIYASALTDKEFIHHLVTKQIAIRIIVAPSTKIFNQKSLCQHHIAIHYLEKPSQHAKALLRDYNNKNVNAYVGSANLSYPGLSTNREVGLLFSDVDALKQLHQTFEDDWQNSETIC